MGRHNIIMMEFLIYTCISFHLYSYALSQTDQVIKFLHEYDTQFAQLFHMQYEAMFTRATNITDYNSRMQNKVSASVREKLKELRRNASLINITGISPDLKRQYNILISTKSTSNTTIANKISEIGTDMENIYSKGTIPYDENIIKTIEVKPGTKELRLEMHLDGIMTKSTDPTELLYVWKSWRDSVGPKVGNLYPEYVRLNNIGARENGYQDAGDYKRKAYEVNHLEDMVEGILNDMHPFYEELHGYVRHRLSKVYPNLIEERGLIPAHLLGNMWAQNWGNIYRLVVPYADEPTLDVSPNLKEKHTVAGMFKMAEDFFVSLGWPKLPKKFWSHSLMIEPKDGRSVVCHASAWDFMINDNGEPDVRVKMCTKQTQRDFITVHHELGHIYYDLLYWNQPLVYRDGANPGFHEAVGDTLALSVKTPAHLNAVGLLSEVSQTEEADINYLLKTSLDITAFLPFAFVMDKWMWGMYSGEVKPGEYNKKWWEYRRKYQGIKAPVERTEKDFDPGAKFHIPADTSYIRYFFANILQFAFHKQACKLAGNTKPLHQCSIYQSKVAGKGFGDMLALGKSKPWPEALKLYTGSEKISTEPIKEYFAPLIKFLKEYREKEKYVLGWDSDKTGDKKIAKSVDSAGVIHVISYILILLSFVIIYIFI